MDGCRSSRWILAGLDMIESRVGSYTFHDDDPMITQVERALLSVNCLFSVYLGMFSLNASIFR